MAEVVQPTALEAELQQRLVTLTKTLEDTRAKRDAHAAIVNRLKEVGYSVSILTHPEGWMLHGDLPSPCWAWDFVPACANWSGSSIRSNQDQPCVTRKLLKIHMLDPTRSSLGLCRHSRFA